MATIGFDPFEFDWHQQQLTKNGTDIELRPKTALLLKFLLEHQQQILSKRALIMAVWGSEHVSDQSLFQAVSELRRNLAPLSPIKTYPNRGYQWIETTRKIANQSASLRWFTPITQHYAQMTTTLVLVAGVVIFGMSNNLYHFNPIESKMTSPSVPNQNSQTNANLRIQIPAAFSAFARGVEQLRAGNIDSAHQLLSLSARENPSLNEAQLLLAEVLLQQGDPLRARTRALSLINNKETNLDAYSLMTAMDVISRSEAKLGKNSSALAWATEALQTAHSEGFVCAAFDLQDRLNVLQQPQHVNEDSSYRVAITHTGELNEHHNVDASTLVSGPSRLATGIQDQLENKNGDDHLSTLSELRVSISTVESREKPEHCSKLTPPEFGPDSESGSLDLFDEPTLRQLAFRLRNGNSLI